MVTVTDASLTVSALVTSGTAIVTELASLRKEGAVELETDGTGTLEMEGTGALEMEAAGTLETSAPVPAPPPPPPPQPLVSSVTLCAGSHHV